jgi:hypothetical protein
MEPLSICLSLANAKPTIITEFRMTGKYVKDVAELKRKAEGKDIVIIGATFTRMSGDKAVNMRHYSNYYFDGDAPELK